MASIHEVMDLNQRSMPKRAAKEGKREIKRIDHEKSENGGHIFTHHVEQGNGPYREPEHHTFGKEEGRAALEHFAKHAGLSEHLEAPKEEKPGEGEDEEGDEDSAAGAAT